MRRAISRVALASAMAAATAIAPAEILITEIAPSVTLAGSNGDTVELFNTGPGPVNLTNWVLSDMDGTNVNTDIRNDPTFAPSSLSLPALQPNQFAVVIFRNNTPSYVSTNYGLLIYAAAPDLSTGNFNSLDQCVLASPDGVIRDSVVWTDGTLASSFEATDVSSLTPPTSDYGTSMTVDGQWSGPDVITTATYNANVENFSSFSSSSTYGEGVIRRRIVSGAWSIGAPDSTSNFEVVSRARATFGWYHQRVSVPGGFEPTKFADALTTYISELEDSNYPDYRIATGIGTNDYKVPPPADLTAFRAVMAAAREGRWSDAYGLAQPLGYEVVEFFDIPSSRTYYIFREANLPGTSNYRGGAIVIFDASPSSNPRLLLEAPHPIFDQYTAQELALAIEKVRPRFAIVAGTHRNNATTDTLCDGELTSGVPYKVSDPAHEVDSFFDMAHQELCNFTSQTTTIQFHGFGGTEAFDAILSTGRFSNPPNSWLIEKWRTRINASLTYTAGVYGDDANVLGGTTNVQGRFINGVPYPSNCDTYATSHSSRFIHIEQDNAARLNPTAIIDALDEAINDAGLVPVSLSSFSME